MKCVECELGEGSNVRSDYLKNIVCLRIVNLCVLWFSSRLQSHCQCVCVIVTLCYRTLGVLCATHYIVHSDVRDLGWFTCQRRHQIHFVLHLNFGSWIVCSSNFTLCCFHFQCILWCSWPPTNLCCPCSWCRPADVGTQFLLPFQFESSLDSIDIVFEKHFKHFQLQCLCAETQHILFHYKCLIKKNKRKQNSKIVF